VLLGDILTDLPEVDNFSVADRARYACEPQYVQQVGGEAGREGGEGRGETPRCARAGVVPECPACTPLLREPQPLTSPPRSTLSHFHVHFHARTGAAVQAWLRRAPLPGSTPLEARLRYHDQYHSGAADLNAALLAKGRAGKMVEVRW
jgi:hypothetical protein